MPLERIWACDIEADSLTPTVVWCMCCVNCDTKEEVRLREYSHIKEWIISQASLGCVFVFHNGLGYDAPNLNKLVGAKLTLPVIFDTMLMSMVYSPSLEGGHRLEDWGNRLGCHKGEWSDWSKWSQEMEDYCMQDCHVGLKTYLELRRRMTDAGFTEEGIELEHRSWSLIQQQKKNGFYFNYQEASILYAKLKEIEDEYGQQVHKLWPPVLTLVRNYRTTYKKDGSYTKNFIRHTGEFPKVRRCRDGSYNVYDYVPFNIGSPSQRTARLLELGWEPREFTKPSPTNPEGLPQPFVKGELAPSLVEFLEKTPHPGARLIAHWIEYNARANMINTWMEAYNDDTGCIHGSLWLANTLRYRHSGPNTANIPAVRLDKEGHPLLGRDGVYTYEARNLWTTRDSRRRRLVGVDAKGIQLRVLANYLNNVFFTKEVLDGDPHSYNQAIGGFATRPIAKTFIYAFLLGAGDGKVGQIIGDSTAAGKSIKARFVNNFPGLKELLDDLGGQVKRVGRIVLCDGTPLLVTAPHTRLGYLLQGDESRIMKRAAVYVADGIHKQRLDALKVGDIHDEWQYDVLSRDVTSFIELCKDSFKRAGESFNYRLPIDCDAKVGLTWAETH